MTYNMQHIVNKILRRRKGLMFSTLVSLIIGITIVLTLLSLATQSEKILLSDIQKQYGNMDLYIEFEDKYSGEKLANLSQFLDEQGTVKETSIVYVGQAAVNSSTSVLNTSAYTVGTDNSILAKSRYKYAKDLSSKDCILNYSLAKALNIQVGDQIEVDGTKLKLSEIIEDVKDTSSIPDVLIIHQTAINLEKFKPYILIDAIEAGDVLALTQEIKKFDQSLLVNSLYDDHQINMMVQSTRNFLVFLAVISIVMCACMIVSNLQLFIFSFSKQLAMLRIVGMSRHQAFVFLLRIGTTLNGVGTLLAFVLYVGMQFFIESKVSQIVFNVSLERSFLLNQAIGVTVLCFLALETVIFFAALKLRHISPLATKRKNEKTHLGKKSLLLGVLCYLFSILLYAKNLEFIFTEGADISLSTQMAVVSVILFIMGSLILLGYFLEIIFGLLILVSEKMKIALFTMGLKLIRPQMKRNFTIVIALTSIFIITIISGGMYSTVRFNNHQFIEQQFELDLVITDRSTETLIDKYFVSRLKQEPSIDHVAVIGENYSFLNIAESSHYVRTNYVSFDELRKIGTLNGNDFDASKDVIVYEAFAKKNGLSVGDTLNLSSMNLSDLSNPEKRVNYHPFVIYEIIPGDEGEVILDWTYDYFDNLGRNIKTIHVASNDIEKTVLALESSKSLYPTMKWQTKKDAFAEADRLLAARFMTIILVMSLVFILVNVASFNLLISNLLSKKKEYAILRAIHLDKKSYIHLMIMIPLIYQMIAAFFGFSIGLASIHMLSFIDSKKLAHIDLSFPSVALLCTLGIGFVIFNRIGKKMYREKISEALKYEF